MITGIQRVIKEFITISYKKQELDITYLFHENNHFHRLSLDEIIKFLHNIENYKFSDFKVIDIFENPSELKIFFDVDTIWNASLKREDLYFILKQNNFKIFNFIYDLIPVLYPMYMRDLTARNFPSFLKAVCKYSDFIFFDSQSAQKDFNDYKIKYYQNSFITSKIVYLGSDFSYKKATPTHIHKKIQKNKYILFVGTLEPRKKHSLVLEAFDKLSSQYSDLYLIFIGKNGWKVDSFVEKIKKHPLFEKRFFWLDDINDDILYSYYSNAFLVTYLSLYEGFGLPISESLSCGNITITSQNGSIKEVGKNYVDYIENDDINGLINLITLYYNNIDIYKERKTFINSNYHPIKWENVYLEITEVFKSFLDKMYT